MNTTTPNHDNDSRSSQEIEAEIRETRSRMDATLDELGSRLTPRSLLNSAFDWWESPDVGNQGSATGRKAVVGLARQARRHPVPALLIGSGIAWLIADSMDDETDHRRTGSGRRLMPVPHPATDANGEGVFQHALDSAAGAVGAVNEKAGDITKRVQQAREHFLDQAHDGMEQGKSTLRKLKDEAKEGYQMGADRFGRACDEYPLGVGVGFAALGVLAGLLIPRTRREDEWMGEASDHVVAEGREKAEELLDSGKAVGQRVMQSVKDEIDQQGLTGSAVVRKISDMASQVGAVVQTAGNETLSAAMDEVAGHAGVDKRPSP